MKEELIEQTTAVTKSIERFKNNLTRPIGLYGHDCGVHPINMAIGGLIRGKFTTIAGRSGSGKSGLEVQMLSGISRVTNGIRGKALIFSWELTSDYIVDRYISYFTGLTNRALTQGVKLLSASQKSIVNEAYKTAKSMPIVYHEYSTNIRTVKRISEKFIADCGDSHPVIIVDYLGLAEIQGGQLKTYGIADFVNGLKAIANQTGATVVLLVQINRSSDEKENGPDRTDLSDSQAIEQASDNVVIIHRPEHFGIATIKDHSTGSELPSKGLCLVKVEKSRDYGQSQFLMRCDVALNRFWAMEDDWNTRYWNRYADEEFWKNNI